MCGVFGWCASSGGCETDVAKLAECRDTLSHRGPDAFGSHLEDGVYLGFRRLAILDVSSDGDQPMSTQDGRYTIVFNGEIYNYLELRAQLENGGARFRGRSDTEVLLSLFATRGEHCLQELNGMFAFSVFDKQTRTLFLARDRLGVKPLFFWRQRRTFAFASELRALRGLPGFPRELSADALGMYFRVGTVPDWMCIYPGVGKVPAGCWMRYHVESGDVEGPVSYWDLPPVGEDEGKSEEQWIDEIESLIWDATRIRLRSDVPLGVFLSGGVDSGLVAAAAGSQRDGLTSLTIGFAGTPEDETAMALATAERLNFQPVVRNVRSAEGARELQRVMSLFDEPFSDVSALPTSMVCAEARKQFTVVLSGDGGDELFGGYESHVRAWRWRWMDWIPRDLRRHIASALAAVSPADSLPERFVTRVMRPVGRFGLGAKLYVCQRVLDRCLKSDINPHPDKVMQMYDQHLPAWSGASSIDLAQRTDLRTYLLDDILVKVDRMSMQHSVEVRSPFLDYRLVELALRVPSRLRTKNGCSKYLLRKLASRHLPAAICDGVKKGFGIPFRSWVADNENTRSLSETLSRNGDGHIDPFVPGGAESLWEAARKNKSLESVVIRMLCYRWWCQGR